MADIQDRVEKLEQQALTIKVYASVAVAVAGIFGISGAFGLSALTKVKDRITAEQARVDNVKHDLDEVKKIIDPAKIAGSIRATINQIAEPTVSSLVKVELSTLEPSVLLNALPKGTILAWKPAPGDKPPSGWALCDGDGNTPKLTGRYLVGAPTFADNNELGKELLPPSRQGANITVSTSDASATAENAVHVVQGQRTDLKLPKFEHQHTVAVPYPPSVQVFYIIKIS